MKAHALGVMVATIIVALLVPGCATTNDRPLTTDQKIAGCVSMVMVGAVLAKAMNKSARNGAAVGLGVCGVWLAFNNEADKRRLRAAQANAAASGRPQQQTWRDNQTGAVKTISVVPSALKSEATTGSASLVCRDIPSQVTANGQSSDVFSTEWCRSPDNTWRPRAELAAN